MLQAIGWEDAGTTALLDELARWHAPAFAGIPDARRWLVNEVLPAADRVLFWVKDVRGRPVGHVGLSHLDPVGATITLTDVQYGVPVGAALVDRAIATLSGWAQHSLRLHVRGEERPRAAA
jgi:hypothetical protein